MALIDISQETFEHYCQALDYNSFFQTPQMANLLSKRGAKTQFIGLKKDGELKVAAMLFSQKVAGGWRLELNAGPNTNFSEYLKEFYSQLCDYAKKNHVLELVVKPYDNYQTFDDAGNPTSIQNPKTLKFLESLGFHHDGFKTGYPNGEPVWHYLKDLTSLTSVNLMNSYSKNGKALAKKAKTFGIKLQKLSRQELQVFKDITSATSDRRDYDDKPLSYYQDFYDSFGDACEFMIARLNFTDYVTNLKKNQDKLALKIAQLQLDLSKNLNSVKKQNQLRELSDQFETFEIRIAEAQNFINTYGDKEVTLAGSLFVYTPQEAVYLFSGSFTEFNKFYAPTLLQEHVMQTAIKKQIKTYNFLGITGKFDGSDGVLRFKQNFNGYIIRKLGTFRYYPNPLKYRMIELIKKLLKRY
ncbi:aminoacyltransferase [Streptococcus castoreus]|uniref:aminoacyltransferase n=1 Tax=Streptococcus castoreus TaxID=254786 RepID=UPI0004074EDC|nr:aminoacyltransferase [Streptococcus castoreus]